MGLFGKKKLVLPPVPDWKPTFNSNTEEIISIFNYYSSGKRDFVVFKNNTVVIVDNGLNDDDAIKAAKDIINKIYNFHPDMTPQHMDDGNILVSYKHPAFNVVIEKNAQEHWEEIEAHHLESLCTSEVLMTPLGPNKFDDFGKKALWARCYFFMDAQKPEAIRIVRKSL
jgi:hypothetical protein